MCYKFCTSKEVSDLCVIHYGSIIYDLERFKPVKNYRKLSKPGGGLWTSPINSTNNWKIWCKNNDYRYYPEDLNFKLKFNNNAKILIINSVKDIEDFPLRKGLEYLGAIDFETIFKECDALWLTTNGLEEAVNSFPILLIGWDVETIFIANKECCYQI
jgi:hypothetical protein